MTPLSPTHLPLISPYSCVFKMYWAVGEHEKGIQNDVDAVEGEDVLGKDRGRVTIMLRRSSVRDLRRSMLGHGIQLVTSQGKSAEVIYIILYYIIFY